MKNKAKDTKSDNEAAAVHSDQPALPELSLQVCPKCQVFYDAVRDKCPKCGAPRPGAPLAESAKKPEAIDEPSVGVDQPPAEVKTIPEWPFVNQPAEQGGVIIAVESGKVFRPMTESDVAEAAEEIGKVSITHAEVSAFLRQAEARVANLEQALKEHRSIVRNAEIRLLDVGAELAVLGRAVNSGQREWKTQLVLTYTTGNEIVVTDAKTGMQIGERRTATKDEAKKANGQTTGLLPPKDTPAAPSDVAESPKTGGKKRRTTDSPSQKPDPGEQPVRVSVSSSAFNRLTPPRKDGMRKVPGTDEDPGFALNWGLTEDGERLYVEIPRRLLPTVRTLAGPTLDFKQDTGAVVAEIT